MRCRKIHRLLSLYLDGEVRPPQREAVEEHLRSCAKCRAALNDLRLLVSQAENLAPATLTSDLWPAIERRVLGQPALSPAGGSRLVPLSGWRPRFAWALAVATVFLAFFLLRHHIYSPRPSPPVPQSQSQLLATAKSDIELARTHYENSIATLEQIVAHRAHEMDQDRFQLYQEKLARLEETIGECSMALEKNSFDIRAQRALFDAYDKKISTLREMAVAAPY